jgi:hypothetical protein
VVDDVGSGADDVGVVTLGVVLADVGTVAAVRGGVGPVAGVGLVAVTPASIVHAPRSTTRSAASPAVGVRACRESGCAATVDQ